jgi:acetyl-CoA C-acetyltransferase
MKEVFVVDAKRTAVGSFMGSLSKIPAHELGAIVIRNLLSRNQLDSGALDEVIMGQVITSGQGQNPARQAAIAAGIDVSVPAYTINKVCGSGLKSVALAFDSIRNGDADLIIAGGQENMSYTPHGIFMRSGVKYGSTDAIDLMAYDGLTDAFSKKPMGITAENVAKKYGITRDVQDEFAFLSQKKASEAINSGHFVNQIVPVKVINKKETIDFILDEFVRGDTSLEQLGKLRPAFDKEGSVTAGNASGINDGAAALLLASSDAVKKYNLNVIARVVSHAASGVEPEIMGIGPSRAVQKLMQKTNWKLQDLDIIESNEAFAAQALAVDKILEWDTSKVNVTGGSIAIGHPIGASGARVTVTLLHNMKRLGAKKALSTLCIGGGMGIAMCFEAT